MFGKVITVFLKFFLYISDSDIKSGVCNKFACDCPGIVCAFVPHKSDEGAHQHGLLLLFDSYALATNINLYHISTDTLRALYLGDNDFEHIPPEIGRLKNLQIVSEYYKK